MQINKLNKCCKPISFNNYSKEKNRSNSENTRYKHFKQMDDELLSIRSTLKAHQEVSKSGKMKLYKALPVISTALLSATIGLTQPGKLSSKALSGLGFLALLGTSEKVLELTNKKPENDEDLTKNMFRAILTPVALSFMAIGGINLLSKNKNSSVTKFLSNEVNKFSNEVNNSKLGKFFENKVSPFANKHKNLTNTATFLAPFGTLLLSISSRQKLQNSLSKDIKEKANKNFAKAKIIQEIAKQEFNSIDAVEV